MPDNLKYRETIGIWEKDFTERKEIQEEYENKIIERTTLEVLRKISQQYKKYTCFEKDGLDHVENNPVAYKTYKNKRKCAIDTCYLRGWIELIPGKKSWSKDGYGEEVYRATAAGWDRLDNLRPWVIATFIMGLMSFCWFLFK